MEDHNILAHTQADPIKSTQKYMVYRNDIKYKAQNSIDLDRAVFENDEVRQDFMSDTNGVEYRIKECFREKGQVLDVAHTSASCTTKTCMMDRIIAHPKFQEIKDHIIIISSNDMCDNLYKTPLDFSVFSNLLSLNLSNNGLSSLPNLPASLEELIIDSNKISHIPMMRHIKRIRARQNNLSRIDYTPSLESLNVSDNPELQTIVNLPNLYYLDIARTGITQIPECPNLKYLDMSETRISVLQILPSLCILRCEKSDLRDISALQNLYVLMTTDSKVRTIHYMDTLQKLTYSGEHKKDIKLSSRYKVYNIVKNSNDVYDITLKAKPVVVKILN